MARKYTEYFIEIDSLYINNKNPRLFGDFTIDQQQEIIEAHITFKKETPEHYFNLIVDILKVGEIFDKPFALEKDGKKIIYDGNRRTIASKIIMNPEFSPTLKERVVEAKSKYGNWLADEKKIYVDVTTDETYALEKMRRSNIGADKGVGPMSWERLIHATTEPNSVFDRLLQYLNDNKILPIMELVHDGANYEALSTLFKVSRMKAYGIEIMANGKPVYSDNKTTAQVVVQSMIKFASANRERYNVNFNRTLKSFEEITDHFSLKKKSKIKTTKGQAKKSNMAAEVVITSYEYSEYHKITSSSKIKSILNEFIDHDPNIHTSIQNLISVRVIIDIAVNNYMAENNLSPGDSLVKTVVKVGKHLISKLTGKNKQADAAIIQSVIDNSAKKGTLIGLTHAYVHKSGKLPTTDEGEDIFNLFFPFLKLMEESYGPK